MLRVRGRLWCSSAAVAAFQAATTPHDNTAGTTASSLSVTAKGAALKQLQAKLSSKSRTLEAIAADLTKSFFTKYQDRINGVGAADAAEPPGSSSSVLVDFCDGHAQDVLPLCLLLMKVFCDVRQIDRMRAVFSLCVKEIADLPLEFFNVYFIGMTKTDDFTAVEIQNVTSMMEERGLRPDATTRLCLYELHFRRGVELYNSKWDAIIDGSFDPSTFNNVTAFSHKLKEVIKFIGLNHHDPRFLLGMLETFDAIPGNAGKIECGLIMTAFLHFVYNDGATPHDTLDLLRRIDAQWCDHEQLGKTDGPAAGPASNQQLQQQQQQQQSANEDVDSTNKITDGSSVVESSTTPPRPASPVIRRRKAILTLEKCLKYHDLAAFREALEIFRKRDVLPECDTPIVEWIELCLVAQHRPASELIELARKTTTVSPPTSQQLDDAVKPMYLLDYAKFLAIAMIRNPDKLYSSAVLMHLSEALSAEEVNAPETPPAAEKKEEKQEGCFKSRDVVIDAVLQACGYHTTAHTHHARSDEALALEAFSMICKPQARHVVHLLQCIRSDKRLERVLQSVESSLISRRSSDDAANNVVSSRQPSFPVDSTVMCALFRCTFDRHDFHAMMRVVNLCRAHRVQLSSCTAEDVRRFKQLCAAVNYRDGMQFIEELTARP